MAAGARVTDVCKVVGWCCGDGCGGRRKGSAFERLMHSFVDRDLNNLLPVLGMVGHLA